MSATFLVYLCACACQLLVNKRKHEALYKIKDIICKIIVMVG